MASAFKPPCAIARACHQPIVTITACRPNPGIPPLNVDAEEAFDCPEENKHFTLISKKERRDQGGIALVIEHGPDMIARADWIIDLVPGRGQDNRQITAARNPRQVADASDFATG